MEEHHHTTAALCCMQGRRSGLLGGCRGGTKDIIGVSCVCIKSSFCFESETLLGVVREAKKKKEKRGRLGEGWEKVARSVKEGTAAGVDGSGD